jgi:hypothetical protein
VGPDSLAGGAGEDGPRLCGGGSIGSGWSRTFRSCGSRSERSRRTSPASICGGIGFKALDDGFAAARTRPPWRPSGGGSRPRMFTRSSRVGSRHCRARSHDQARGYGYDLAFRQLVMSDTRVFHRPAAGRAWFERMLPDQLTLGRPDQIAIVFARHVFRCIPGRSHTKDHHLRRAALNPSQTQKTSRTSVQ